MSETPCLALKPSELARRWQCSPSAIGKKVKAGMPLTSEDEARAWVLSHSIRKPRALIGKSSSATTLPSQAPPTLIPIDDPLAAILKDVHASRESANKSLQAAQAGDDRLLIGAAIKNHSDAVNAAMRAEDWVTATLKERGQLVPIESAKAVITRALAPIAAALDGFAASNAPRCNPAAPMLADAVLRESIEAIRAQIRSALP